MILAWALQRFMRPAGAEVGKLGVCALQMRPESCANIWVVILEKLERVGLILRINVPASRFLGLFGTTRSYMRLALLFLGIL